MKNLINGAVMGFCGAIAVLTSTLLQIETWVLFLAWVSYYLFGKTPKKAIEVSIPITAGILMGIFIQTMGLALGSQIGKMSFPVTVFLCIFSMAFLSKIKIFNNIPAWFIGLIIYFGSHLTVEQPGQIIKLFGATVLGFLFAYLNESTHKLLLQQTHKTI